MERLRRIEDVATCAPDYIIQCDQSGMIHYMNRPAPGHDLSQMIGTSVERWMAPENRADFRACLARVFATGAMSSYDSVGSVSGRHYVNRMSPVLEHGRVASVILVTHDVTERRKLEEQTRQAQRLETLGHMAAGIAHDLNNILQAIRSEADRLARNPRAPEGAEAGRRIAFVTERAAELTGQLLAFAGKQPMRVVPLDAAALVREMAPMLGISARRPASLVFEADSPGCVVEGDPVQLRQVVLNLVLNAAEALPMDGGRITVRVRRQALNAASHERLVLDASAGAGDFVTIEVVDDGHGIDPAVLPKVFDPFFTTRAHGRGLGLATALGIVRAHRGALEVESTPGRGSRFAVHLPWSPRAPEAARTELPASPALKGGKVLVADDEQTIRTVVRAMLMDLGCDCVTAVSGPDAVAALAAEPSSFSAALVDFTMPGCSAAQTIEGLRALQPGLPVVVMSGYAGDYVEGSLAGARFLPKPFSLEHLAAALGLKLPPSRPDPLP